MTPYSITWADPATAAVKRLDAVIRRRIFDKVDGLADDPFRFVSRLVNSPSFRLRVGDWRILLDIDRNGRRIHVLEVGHRKSIYG